MRLPGWPRPATLCFGLARWLPCLRSRWLWQPPRYTRDYHSRCGNGYGKLPAPLDAPNRARSKEIFPAGVQVQLRPTGLQPWHFPAAPISALSPFEKPGSWEWMQGKMEPALIFGGTGGASCLMVVRMDPFVPYAYSQASSNGSCPEAGALSESPRPWRLLKNLAERLTPFHAR